MDRIEQFKFDGSFQQLTVKAAIKKAESALRQGHEPEYYPENELCWIDFKIEAIISKRKQWFPCQFKILKEDKDWFVQVQFDSKGFAGKRFQDLLGREEELIANTILEFVMLTPLADVTEVLPKL